MKIFISGPMKNKPNGNKEAFFEAEHKLKRLGYSVFNPAWCEYGYNTEFTEDDMHMIDFSALSRCDAIYMLKGWQYSKGAKAEYDHAKILCKAILREGDPITDPLICDKYDWESWKKKLPDRLDNHADKIDTLEDEVEAIKESIGTDNLQEQLEKDFADVYEEFQTTKDKVNDIEFGYIDWSSKMSSAIDEMEKVKGTVKGLNSLVATLGERNGVLSDNIYELQRIIISSDIKNISIKAINQKLIDLGKELDVHIDDYNEECWTEIHRLSKEIENLNISIGNILIRLGDHGRDVENVAQKHCNDNKTVNNTLTDLNIRLKAVEKRLSIKPFYGPDEDDD